MENLNLLLKEYLKSPDCVNREVDDKFTFKNYDGKEHKDIDRIQYYSVFKIRYEEAKPYLKKQFEIEHPKLKLYDNLINASLMASKKNVSKVV